MYDGTEWVAIPGKHRARIPVPAVRALFTQFQQAEFFWTLDEYEAVVSDTSSYLVAISFDGHAKTVTERMGFLVGLPQIVGDLEDRIDAVAGTKTWVEGDAGTIAHLKAEGWDFRVRADKNSALLATVVEQGDAALLRQLMDAGISTRNPFGCAAMETAARDGKLDMVELLAAAGTPANAPEYKSGSRFYPRCLPLSAAAEGGNTKIVELVLSLHPDIDAKDYHGRTALMEAVHAVTYLADGQDRIAVLRRVLAAGADVNARDGTGRTALMKGGIDPDVTEALLEAGADPYSKDKNGKTVLDWVGRLSNAAPVLARWMAAHPPK